MSTFCRSCKNVVQSLFNCKNRLRNSRKRARTSSFYYQGSRALTWDRICPCCRYTSGDCSCIRCHCSALAAQVGATANPSVTAPRDEANVPPRAGQMVRSLCSEEFSKNECQSVSRGQTAERAMCFIIIVCCGI